jgi:hypothetical protein
MGFHEGIHLAQYGVEGRGHLNCLAKAAVLALHALGLAIRNDVVGVHV